MARRFNLDLDSYLALEGYDFETHHGEVFEIDLDFGAAFNPNITALTLFSESYDAFVPVDTIAPLSDKEDSPLEAPQLPGQPLQNGPFGAVFELSSLLVVNGGDGSLGFVVNGINSSDRSGISVSSAGDVNGDGFDDFIVGASGADPNGNIDAGQSYVIFGTDDAFAASFNLSSLLAINGGDGTIGFVINGISEGDFSGGSVSSAGDLNGDGFDDLFIGASRADPNAGGEAGASYVIFGSDAGFSATVELASLNGTNGFVINGIDSGGPNDIGDRSGSSLSSAGDINGDGFDDLIIGAYRADPNGLNYAGESYVVFGNAGTSISSLDLASLDGNNGFSISGVGQVDLSGSSVSSAGDINGDGFDDIIIGAPFGLSNSAGKAYVIYGSDTGFAANLALADLNGANGFSLIGIDSSDDTGVSVSSAGDFNGDGVDDLIIGARRADPNGNSSGESYVVFGSVTGFGASLNLSSLLAVNGGDGSTGFVINGVEVDDNSGQSVSSAGDINGDGFDDIIIGARYADPNGNSSGESYVLFGGNSNFGTSFELSSIDGVNGIVFNGIGSSDSSGRSLSSAGDINGDGLGDLIIGAPNGDLPGGFNQGESYVIYGQVNSEFELSSLLAVNGGDGTSGFVINGIDVDDFSGNAISSAGDINGDGFDDILIGARGADPNGENSGESYIVFGQEGGFAASLELSALNGANGFVINGTVANDRSGTSVSSAGDINGDGFDDFLIGTPSVNSDFLYSIKSYVVFGQAGGFGASLDLSTINGTNGFVINGIATYDPGGITVSSAGDVNGDGFDDILIGAIAGNTNGSLSGDSYVVFGQASGFGASIDVSALDGTNGFTLNGIDSFDFSGGSVSSAGDINGDGFDDILIGASSAGPTQNARGESYVVFGQATGFAANLDLSSLDGTNGFVINGIAASDYAGRVSSAGDINGDGFDDVLVGASGADPNGSRSGASYIVFGQAGSFGASLDLSSLNGSNGFVINGIDAEDRSGGSASSAGDVNGDGLDDILIGAFSAEPNGTRSGESYVVFGQTSGFGPSLDLSSLDGTNGFVINGIDADDISGSRVSSAGDIDGDGFDDILIGASSADPNGSQSGETYVIYGRADFGRVTEILSVNNDSYTASDNGEVVHGLAGDDVINGGASSDVLFGDEGNDTLSGNGGNDRLIGGAGDDSLDGGADNDVAVYDGNLSDYDIINNGDGTYTVTDNVTGNGVDTLTNIETVQIGTELIDLTTLLVAINGTAGNDNLTGTAIDEAINGLAGNDVLDGLAGDDQINGGDGADRLIGGDGADANNGGAGFDSVDYRGATSGVRFNVETGGTLGEAAGDTFSGIERYYLSGFNDIITGSDANEFFFGEDGNDQINGGAGIDRIYGGEGNDIQRGQDGNDTLYGSAGSDQLNGGAGFDIANYTLAAAGVTVNMLTGGTGGDAAGDTYFGIEAVYGSDFDDSLTGNNSVNELRGGDGDDALFGLGGNDRFFGGNGADAFDGGTGTDIVNYTLAASGVTLDLTSGGTAGEAAGDSFTSIEWVFGSAFDDDITGDAANNRLEGRDGNDTLNGEGGNDRLLGGDGNDTINGGDGVDTIFGQAGDDVMSGGAGNDFFFGGAGTDIHDGGDGFDTVSYLTSTIGLTIGMEFGVGSSSGDAAGDEFISIERVLGSRFDDSISGGVFDDILVGNGGNDFLFGSFGNDSLIGGAGVDSFGYGTQTDGADVIFGFGTNELIYLFSGEGIYDTFADVMAVGSDAGANVVFDFGGGNTLTIVGRNLADLDAGNFDLSGIPPASEPLSDPDAFAADIVDAFDMDALI